MEKFDTTEFVKQKHGRITIIHEIKKNKRRYFLCKCDCGTIWDVALTYIKSGKIKSCGCLSTELKKQRAVHGFSRRGQVTREYKIWLGIKRRCYNKNNARYMNYGGRGIVISESWKQFINFFNDMGLKPDSLTLERIDNNGNYCKENCKWATVSEQNLNTTRTVRHLYNGKNLTPSEWAKETGINIGTLSNRLNNPNWSLEKSLTHPIYYK